MKKFVFVLITLVSASIVIGCGSNAKAASSLVPDNDNAVVSVQRTKGGTGALPVYVDGHKVGELKVGDEIRFLVPNGNHSIYVGVQNIMVSEQIDFEANSNLIMFTSYIQMGMWKNTAHLTRGHVEQLK